MAVSIGEDLYYDAETGKVVKTVAEGKAKVKVGYAVSAASASDTEVAVKLAY